MGEYIESPEERLRSALSSIVGRGESFSNLSARPMPPIAVSMMGEAIEGLAEAYPSDPLYRDWLTMWRHTQSAAAEARGSQAGAPDGEG